MKDFTKEQLEESRPDRCAETCINFCLDMLYKDDHKRISDQVVYSLSYEELIGALLKAKDEIVNSYPDYDQ